MLGLAVLALLGFVMVKTSLLANAGRPEPRPHPRPSCNYFQAKSTRRWQNYAGLSSSPPTLWRCGAGDSLLSRSWGFIERASSGRGLSVQRRALALVPPDHAFRAIEAQRMKQFVSEEWPLSA